MMNVKNKAILWITAGVFAALLISAVFAGFVRSSERNADKRIGGYAERSKAAEKLAEGIQQRTGDLEGQLQSAGNETSECIAELREGVTELGELQDGCDRIAEAGRGIEAAADGIEGRILVCLQILGAPEESEKILERYGFGLYDPGGH